jgi:hypothetical protein
MFAALCDGAPHFSQRFLLSQETRPQVAGVCVVDVVSQTVRPSAGWLPASRVDYTRRLLRVGLGTQVGAGFTSITCLKSWRTANILSGVAGISAQSARSIVPTTR